MFVSFLAGFVIHAAQPAISFEDYKWIHRKLLMQRRLRSGFDKRKHALLASLAAVRGTQLAKVSAFVAAQHAKRVSEDAEADDADARKQKAVEQVCG